MLGRFLIVLVMPFVRSFLRHAPLVSFNVTVVEPLIEPLIVSEPSDVVTVQSEVCADGLDSCESTTT